MPRRFPSIFYSHFHPLLWNKVLPSETHFLKSTPFPWGFMDASIQRLCHLRPYLRIKYCFRRNASPPVMGFRESQNQSQGRSGWVSTNSGVTERFLESPDQFQGLSGWASTNSGVTE